MTNGVPRNKAEVTFHSDGFRPSRPAINVKVPMAWSDATKPELLALVSEHEDGKANPHFSPDWCERHVTEDDWNTAFELACELGWEYAQDAALECLGTDQVYSEGRSGGWLIVDGLPDFADWDAVQFGAWQSFVRRVNEEVSDVPYRMAWRIYVENFREWIEQ